MYLVYILPLTTIRNQCANNVLQSDNLFPE